MSRHPMDGVALLGMRLAQYAQALQGGNGRSTTSLGNRHGTMRFNRSKHLQPTCSLAKAGRSSLACRSIRTHSRSWKRPPE